MTSRRDDHIPESEAQSIILTYANLVPQGREQYTSKEGIISIFRGSLAWS